MTPKHHKALAKPYRDNRKTTTQWILASQIPEIHVQIQNHRNRHTDTETQSNRATETQRHRDTEAQRHRDRERERHTHTGTTDIHTHTHTHTRVVAESRRKGVEAPQEPGEQPSGLSQDARTTERANVRTNERTN